MECKFTVGQKVVCVDAANLQSPVLVEGHIYTVSGFSDKSPRLRAEGIAVCITLEGHPNRWDSQDVDVGYNPRRFRPVTTTKTDISIFREIVEREMQKDLLPMGVIR